MVTMRSIWANRRWTNRKLPPVTRGDRIDHRGIDVLLKCRVQPELLPLVLDDTLQFQSTQRRKAIRWPSGARPSLPGPVAKADRPGHVPTVGVYAARSESTSTGHRPLAKEQGTAATWRPTKVEHALAGARTLLAMNGRLSSGPSNRKLSGGSGWVPSFGPFVGAAPRTSQFPARGRKAYCSAARSQRGFRLRRRPADELPLGFARRLPKTAIVYQCSECDARFLGQQRCEECGVFGRRLGPGGPCPHCDEVVAISDLLAELRSITIAAGR
jgi:hypothetical protein